MQLDWYTVTAQVVNFTVLVVALHYLLYGPVTRTLDARRQQVADDLEAAASARRSLEEQRAAREEAAAADRTARAERMRAIDVEVESHRNRGLQEVRTELAEARARMHQELGNQRDHLHAELARRAAAGVVEAAQRVFAELSDGSLEARAAQRFRRSLEDLPDPDRARLVRAAREAREGVVLRAASRLPAATRKPIEAALRHLLGDDVAIRHEVDPSLVAGLELEVGALTMGWNARSRARELAQDIRTALDEVLGPSQEAP